MSDAQLHVIVKGRVQGVGYRFFVCQEAAVLHIKGTVRNRYDGSVEVVAEGKTAALQALLETLKVGPRFGHVSALDVNWLPYSGAYHHFDVIY
jgi:acylphosphatase